MDKVLVKLEGEAIKVVLVGRIRILCVDDVLEDIVRSGRVRGADLGVGAVGGGDGLDVGALMEGDLPRYAVVSYSMSGRLETSSAAEMSLRSLMTFFSVA